VYADLPCLRPEFAEIRRQARSGRKSIDAIVVGGALGAVLLLQASPVGTASGHDPLAVGLYLVTVAFNLAVAGVCIIKGKLTTGLIGIVVPVVAVFGALRLAKPSSVWARRRYSGAKLNRAQHRFGPAYQVRHDRLRDPDLRKACASTRSDLG